MIVYKLKTLKNIPSNCLECICNWCRLPNNAKTMDGVKKEYTTKRHKECPLFELESEADDDR